MLDEKDLLAIGQLLDQKLEEKLEQKLEEKLEQKLEEKLDQKLEEKLEQKLEDKLEQKLEDKLDQKLAQQKEEILTEATHRMKVLLDAEVKPMFNLLAEDISIIREMMVPESRIKAAEDDIDILKAAVRQINREIRELKKAQ